MQRWDIFCRVIDNYGDAGVCWRVARQLAKEHGIQVRLWIDNLPSLAHLVPNLLMDAPVQTIFPNLHVHAWGEDFSHTLPGQVVIEAFACDLPLAYLQAMAAQSPPPVWINLEYLSAEDWVTTVIFFPRHTRRLPSLGTFSSQVFILAGFYVKLIYISVGQVG